MSDGLVVTPSSRPVAASSRISAISAVSTKNFMAHFQGMRWTVPKHTAWSARIEAPASAFCCPYPFDAAFTYEAESALAPGTLVRVPLGPRMVVGVVWDDAPDEAVKVKPVVEVLEFPPLPAALLKFVDWVAAYTLAKRGDVLALGLKESLLAAPPKRGQEIRLWRGGPGAGGAGLLGGTGGGGGGVARGGGRRKKFGVTLLDGVTGSGKTEVYLEAVAEVLRRAGRRWCCCRKSRSPCSFCSGSSARFGAPPAVWHSELTPAVRRETLRAVAEGRANVVVGARSALFLPFPDLGLIVVDEEHESAFKQEDGVMYHARDMAVVRARLSEAPCVLVSRDAEPGDAWRMRAAGRYARLRSAGAAWRGGAAGGARRWICGRIRRSAGGFCRRCWWLRCARRWRAASRRCCS